MAVSVQAKTFVKGLFLDVIWEVFYFPIWWYSRGLKKTAVFCWQRTKGGWRALALYILLANFFRPMYGQSGWDAYLLSLLARLWQISWRLVLMIGWALVWMLVFFVWLAFPVFIIWQFI